MIALAAALVVLVPLLTPQSGAPPALATASEQPGDFDFYVLSLSWSPTYCATDGQDDRFQCGDRAYGFVVHGLWPQYERGWPDYCDDGAAGPTRAEVNDILDLMPGRSLVEYEWEKHGTCTGLAAGAYLERVRDARGEVAIPADFADPLKALSTSPFNVERAFIAANPGLSPGGIAVTCDGRLIEEVRVCLTRDLDFRPCREVDADACRANTATMPAAP